MTPAPRFYTVPKGSRVCECRSALCKAPIYFVITPTESRIPVDCAVDGGNVPTDSEEGRGVSHFKTCVAVKQFSKSSR